MANVVIVGGGITGLYAALLLDDQGHDVTLIERADKPGGLLRSNRNVEGVRFDHGCHFLKDSGLAGVDQIAYDLDPEHWHVYDHNLNVGNFFAGELNRRSLFIQSQKLGPEVYERGIVDFMALEPAVNDVPPRTLADYCLNKFGRTFTDHIFDPVTRKVYGRDLDQLLPEAHMFLSQVRFLAFSEETTRELKKSPFYDARLAFHDSSKDGYGGLKNYYPREGGIEAWVDHFLERIARTDIEILTGESVQAMAVAGDRIVSVDLASGRGLPCDRLVWTAPIFGFLKASGTEFVAERPEMIHVALFNYVFDRPFESDLFYITNYDPDYAMFRVTLYSNIVDAGQPQKAPYRCTVEVFAPEPVDGSALLEVLPEELRRMGVVAPEASIVARNEVPVTVDVPVPTVQYREDFESMRRLARERADNVLFLGLANGHFLQNDALAHAHRKITDEC